MNSKMKSENYIKIKQSHRNVKKPKRFQTTSSDEAPRKSNAQEKDKNIRNIDNDINELGNVLSGEDDNSAEQYSDSDETTSETQHSSQKTSKITFSMQSDTILHKSNSQVSKNATTHPSTLTNVASSYSQTSFYNQTGACTSNSLYTFVPINNTQQYTPHSTQSMPHTSYVSPSTSMSYRQENVQYNPNAYMPYDQNLWPQQTNNNNTPLSPVLNTDTRVVMQPVHNDNRLYEYLDNMSQQMQRLFDIVQNSLKSYKKPQRVLTKPIILPITSMEDMEAFEHIEEDIYLSVVRYFEFLGGFHIKEVVNTCLKEGINDALTLRFTWWGNENRKAFSETRLVRAIFEATCNNANFNPPTRFEFQKYMKEALRTAKERNRSRSRKKERAVRINETNRVYWNDDGTINTENRDPTTDSTK